jgi:protein-disulfide isomerase
MFYTILRRLAGLLCAVLLVACGRASTPAAQPAPSNPPAGAPSNTRATAALPAAQPTTARAPDTAIPAAPTTTLAAPTTAPASGIPEGVTAEGYHYLGRPDAPVTLVMYSDFL